MADNAAKVIIGADDSELRAVMARTQTVIKDGLGQIQGHFDQLTGVIGKVNAAMGAMAAVLAGGSAFSSGIDAVKGMTKEAMSLSRTLGITAEEGNVLNTALGNVFLDKDTYLSASKQITKQLNANGSAFKQLGIDTKDAQGNLLPMPQIIQNTADKLMEFQAGADRNVMANQLLGKSWEDVLKLAKLTPQVMEDAKKEVDEYHKTIDPKMVQRYREAMENVGDVFEGVKIAIGKSAMPSLSQLGEWLSGIGPKLVEGMIDVLDVLCAAFDALKSVVVGAWQVVSDTASAVGAILVSVFGGEPLTALQFFSNCCKVVQIAFIALRTGIQVSAEFIRGAILGLVASIQRFVNVAERAIRMDWSGAREAWKQGTGEIEKIVSDSAKRIAEYSEKGAQDMANAAMPTNYNKNSKSGEEEKKGGRRKAFTLEDGDKEAKSRMSEWENKLEHQKLAYAKMQDAAGTFHEFSKQQEREYWQAIISRGDISQEERFAAERKYYQLSHDIRKKDFDAHIAKLNTELESIQHNMKAKLDIAERIARDTAQRYGKESKEYEEAQQKIIKIKRDAAEQIKKINEEIRQSQQNMALAEVDYAQKEAEFAEEMGLISKEKLLQQQRQYEAKRYDIQRAGLQQRLALMGPDDDPVEREKLLSKLQELDIQYRAKRQDLAHREIKQQMALWTGLTDVMGNLWDKGLTALMNGTFKWRNAMKAVFADVGKYFAQKLVMEPFSQWVAMQVKQLAMKLGFIESEKAAGTGANAVALAEQKAVGMAAVFSNAAIAATAAMGSVAAIPMVGWAMAPGVGAETYATALAYLPSASQGYDIPAGVNPLTQLHQKEMVLPAPYAEVIRSLAAGGGGSGNSESSGSHTVNYIDNSGRLTRDQIRENARVIAEELSRVTRRGWKPS